MDVEKTIEFILENQAASVSRIAKIEETLALAASIVASNTKKIEDLAELLAAQSQASAELERRLVESERRVDERIDKLVSAIGEFMRQRPFPTVGPLPA